MLDISTPSSLSCPGPVLSKRHVRSSKYDPYVDEVELIHAIPFYARVQMQSGREATVSLRDIAPVGEKRVDINETVDNANGVFDSEASVANISVTGDNVSNEDNVCDHDDNAVFPESSGPRGSSSTRIKRAPDRFIYDRSHMHQLCMFLYFFAKMNAV